MDKNVSSKEQRRLEDEFNGSLRYFSKKTQKSIGIAAVQIDENVFYLGNNLYAKVYSLKFKNEEKRGDFLCSLSIESRLRMRFSTISRLHKENGKMTQRFLTVYISEKGYYNASMKYKEFAELLHSYTEKYDVACEECSINNVLSISRLNTSNEYKDFNADDLLKNKGDAKYIIFSSIQEEANCFSANNVFFGCCYKGVHFSEKMEEITEYFRECNYNILSSVDIQILSEDQLEIFNQNLKRRYCHAMFDTTYQNIANVTFLLSVAGASDKDLEEIKRFMHSIKDIVFIPCTGSQTRVYQSLGSLGIIDYHTMRNCNMETVGKLFL